MKKLKTVIHYINDANSDSENNTDENSTNIQEQSQEIIQENIEDTISDNEDINKTYGYARISSSSQNIQRQINTLMENGIEYRDIITDCATGANFNRNGYRALKKVLLKEGDTLVVPSIDRLGRNKRATQREYNSLVKMGVNIKVIDNENLNSDVCNKRELAIEADLAERELKKIKERQRKGIDAMKIDENGKRCSKKTGRPIGRPIVDFPDNFVEVYMQYKSHQITAKSAMEILGLKKNSFYKLVHQYEEGESID